LYNHNYIGLGDGDSSVTKRLRDILPYGPNFLIKKIECRNHLLRNYATKLTTVARHTKYPLRVRKFILTNIIRFRFDVIKAAKHWRNTNNLSMAQKIEGFVFFFIYFRSKSIILLKPVRYLTGLRNDLKNALYHRLGQHTNCEAYFCTGSNASNSMFLVQEAENSGMMRELQNIMSRLTINAESLIENKTNNLCEQFNSIINKHIAGKRIHFCGRRSYNTRVEAAVISFNSKQLLRKIHKRTCSNHSPGIFLNFFLL